jgi:hypothetical protein
MNKIAEQALKLNMVSLLLYIFMSKYIIDLIIIKKKFIFNNNYKNNSNIINLK